MTPDDKSHILSRQQFIENLRSMPIGQAYSRVTDHDWALRFQLVRCRKTIKALYECMGADPSDYHEGSATQEALRDAQSILAATKDEEAGT